MNTLETIYSVLFRTELTLKKIKEDNNFSNSILILFIVSFINSLYIANSFLSSIFISLSTAILIIFLGLFISMFVNLGTNFLGGNANIKETLKVFVYSIIPFIFFPIFNLSILTKLFIIVWSFIIFINGLKEINNFSATKSILSIFSVFGIFSIINSLFFFALIMLLVVSFI